MSKALETHLIAMSDVFAYEKLTGVLPEAFSFSNTKEDYQRAYNQEIKTVEFVDVKDKARYKVIKGLITGQTVLDVGCWNGEIPLALASELPGKQFTGLEINQSVVTMAQHAKAQSGASNVEFVCGDESTDLGTFDTVICSEILEHVPNPVQFIDAVEAKCKSGGRMIFTTPVGPWEHRLPMSDRQHLNHFQIPDLEHVFAHKKGFDYTYVTADPDPIYGSPRGWVVSTYIKSGAKTNPIDYESKLWLQAPRQTVSAQIICGEGGSYSLEWCLKSIRPYVDEILIADCGLNKNPHAWRIAEDYGAIIHTNPPNPIEEGFEAPRNFLIDKTDCDWIFWIDTDEKLVDGQNFRKYLRENVFQGYGIRQHHFGVDQQVKPDMPVRLFRTRPYKDKKMRFFGILHEHPELALNEGPGPIIVLTDVHLAHVGYLCETERKAKFKRNYPLFLKDRERYPNRFLQKHFICRDNIILASQRLMENGGRVDEFVTEKCEEVIELYRKEFLGRGSYVNIDTQPYYAQALKILGRGFDLNFDIQVGKNGDLKPLENNVLHYETVEEALKEIEWRVKDRARQIESVFYG